MSTFFVNFVPHDHWKGPLKVSKVIDLESDLLNTND